MFNQAQVSSFTDSVDSKVSAATSRVTTSSDIVLERNLELIREDSQSTSNPDATQIPNTLSPGSSYAVEHTISSERPYTVVAQGENRIMKNQSSERLSTNMSVEQLIPGSILVNDQDEICEAKHSVNSIIHSINVDTGNSLETASKSGSYLSAKPIEDDQTSNSLIEKTPSSSSTVTSNHRIVQQESVTTILQQPIDSTLNSSATVEQLKPLGPLSVSFPVLSVFNAPSSSTNSWMRNLPSTSADLNGTKQVSTVGDSSQASENSPSSNTVESSSHQKSNSKESVPITKTGSRNSSLSSSTHSIQSLVKSGIQSTLLTSSANFEGPTNTSSISNSVEAAAKPNASLANSSSSSSNQSMKKPRNKLESTATSSSICSKNGSIHLSKASSTHSFNHHPDMKALIIPGGCPKGSIDGRSTTSTVKTGQKSKSRSLSSASSLSEVEAALKTSKNKIRSQDSSAKCSPSTYLTSNKKTKARPILVKGAYDVSLPEGVELNFLSVPSYYRRLFPESPMPSFLSEADAKKVARTSKENIYIKLADITGASTDSKTQQDNKAVLPLQQPPNKNENNSPVKKLEYGCQTVSISKQDIDTINDAFDLLATHPDRIQVVESMSPPAKDSQSSTETLAKDSSKSMTNSPQFSSAIQTPHNSLTQSYSTQNLGSKPADPLASLFNGSAVRSASSVLRSLDSQQGVANSSNVNSFNVNNLNNLTLPASDSGNQVSYYVARSLPINSTQFPVSPPFSPSISQPSIAYQSAAKCKDPLESLVNPTVAAQELNQNNFEASSTSHYESYQKDTPIGTHFIGRRRYTAPSDDYERLIDLLIRKTSIVLI